MNPCTFAVCFVAVMVASVSCGLVHKGQDLQSSGCSPVMCMIYCEHGFALGDDGCPRCVCNPRPVCPPVLCMIACPHGFALGENGCPRCSCNPRPINNCRPVMCNHYCPHGYAKDEYGCDMCQCNLP